MKTVTVPVIKTARDHKAAVKQIEKLWGAEPGTPEGETLDVLLTLVDAYESDRFPIDAPDPVTAILFRMDQYGYGRRELDELLGKTRVSEILNHKRTLSLSMIRKLHVEWNIPAEALIRKPDAA